MENHKRYIDDMLYELAYLSPGNEEFTYNNHLGSITIKIKGFTEPSKEFGTKFDKDITEQKQHNNEES